MRVRQPVQPSAGRSRPEVDLTGADRVLVIAVLWRPWRCRPAHRGRPPSHPGSGRTSPRACTSRTRPWCPRTLSWRPSLEPGDAFQVGLAGLGGERCAPRSRWTRGRADSRGGQKVMRQRAGGAIGRTRRPGVAKRCRRRGPGRRRWSSMSPVWQTPMVAPLVGQTLAGTPQVDRGAVRSAGTRRRDRGDQVPCAGRRTSRCSRRVRGREVVRAMRHMPRGSSSGGGQAPRGGPVPVTTNSTVVAQWESRTTTVS